MDRLESQATVLFEHRFWLQIMGDHARFILMSLAVKEAEEIASAQAFVALFDQLLGAARRDLSGGELIALNQQAYQATTDLRNFKLHLLRRHLKGEIAIQLPPTFINHMLNELDEYVRILNALLAGQGVPVFHPVHHHLLWLPDAAGHAGAIHDNLDSVEKKLKKKSKMFCKHFEACYLKAIEMAGYMRTNLKQFPALSRLNREAELELLLFAKFLLELTELDLSNEMLDTLAPLMLDHMSREEFYYLTKLSQVSEVKRPPGDPTKPRLET